MDFEDIQVEKVEDWIEITINRPEKMNALRERTAEEIFSALSEVEHDRGIHGVILMGSEKAFCTGIETSEFQIGENEFFDFYRMRRRQRQVNRLFRELSDFSKPVIVSVEGYALGGGLELALMADMIIAGKNAKLGLPELRLGMMPGGGGTQTLPRRIGLPLAKELLWTGRRITADEAREYRLVNHVTEAGGALEKAREIIRTIAANAPLPVMLTKGVMNHGMDMSMNDALAAEGDTSFMLYFSRDRDEGLGAFREKRTPTFKGE